MILEVGFNNYKMFKNESIISFKADKRTKYLLTNTVEQNNVEISENRIKNRIILSNCFKIKLFSHKYAHFS